MAIIELDLRFLQPPEPFERTADALDRIGPGDELLVLIHREPRPLYQMLRSSGYRYSVETAEDGCFRIRITLAGR